MKRGVGLAESLKEIDFLPERFHCEIRRKKNAALAAVVSVLLLVLLGLAYVIPQQIIAGYNREMKAREGQIRELERGKAVYNNLQQAKAQNDKLVDVLGEIEKAHFSPLGIIDGISKALPQGVGVSKLTIMPEKVNLTVVVVSPLDAARVIVALRRTGLFKDVDTGSAPLDAGEPQEITFELDLLEKPPANDKKPADFSGIIKDFAWKYLDKGVEAAVENAGAQSEAAN